MALTYRSTSGKSFRLGGGGAPSQHGGHGVFGIFENLGKDLKDAAYGLPEGLVQSVEHPIRAAKAIGHTTWQTWSPLFHGHVGRFAHDFYDHPLAPLLDVATVFSLGAASAAKVGVKLGEDEGVLGLKATRELHDPTGSGRPVLEKHLSRSAGHRLVQEAIMQAEPHMPKWVSGGLERARYEKAHLVDVTHRVAAKNLIVATALKAGKALTDAATAPRARSEIAAGMYLNLLRHGHRMTDDEAAAALKSGHYGVVLDARRLDGEMRLAHHRATNQLDRMHSLRERHAEAAHSLASIEEELAHQNELLAQMREKGHRVANPAETRLKEPTAKQRMEQEGAALVEVQENIKRLGKLRETALKSKNIHERATAQIDRLGALKHEFEQRSFTDYFRKAGESQDAFEQFALNMGRRVVRGGERNVKGKLASAARAQDGRVIVVPLHDAANLGREGAYSSRFVRWLYQKPTRAWKMALLGYSPRVVINNGVGNWFLYLMRSGNPVEALRSVHDGIAAVRGAKVADQTLKHAVPFKHNHWLYRHFGSELGNTFGRSITEGPTGLTSRASQGLYPLVHKLADEPVRAAAITSALRRAPEVKALMDKGLSFDKAAGRALRKNPALKTRTEDYARSIAGDYVTLSPAEKKLREVVPFYLWDRHILKTTKHLVGDQPGRVALTAAVGQQGADKTREQLGDVPDFMLGLVPLPAHQGFRKLALNTVGANPFSTVPELYDAAKAATTGGGSRAGEALGAQMNPLIASLIEQVSGHRLTTDGTVQRRGGILPSVLAETFESLPAAQLVEKAMGKTFTPKAPPLYAHDEDEIIASLAGIPIKKVNLARAHELAAQDAGTKSKHRKKPTFRLGG